MLLFYCTVNQLLIHLIPFARDALLAYLFYKIALLQFNIIICSYDCTKYLTGGIKIKSSSADLFTGGHSLKVRSLIKYILK